MHTTFKSLILFFCLTLTPAAQAVTYSVGAGTQGTYAGRLVPALNLGFDFESYAIHVSSAGIQTSIYYQSSYISSVYKEIETLDGAFGPMRISAGGFIFFSERGYRESPTARTESEQDTTTGPAFQLLWTPTERFYVEFAGQYGLRGLAFIVLSPQEIASFSLGVRF